MTAQELTVSVQPLLPLHLLVDYTVDGDLDNTELENNSEENEASEAQRECTSTRS